MSCCFGIVRKKMNDFATFLLIFQTINLIYKINEVALKVFVINNNKYLI